MADSHSAGAGSSPAPTAPPRTLNEIIRTTTVSYLATIDPVAPPAPSQIEAELLRAVNTELDVENQVRPSRDKFLSLKRLTFSQVAQIMLHLHQICRIGTSGKNSDPDYDLLALYCDEGPDTGIYLTNEDGFRAVARRYDYAMTTNDFREVFAALKDAAPRRYRCMDRDLIPVGNGIFNFRTKVLQPFDPDLVFLSKSQVEYQETAQNVVLHNPEDGTDWDVESWMASLSDDPEVVELLWEITGALLRPMVRWNKSAWLYSEEGNNGKGTLCEAWRNLVGPASYASIPIADFGKDFMLEPLTRAQAIIVDENDVGTYVDRAANLKAVITNDVISINRKHKTPVSYQFYGFMVQCLNEMPRIKDKSESFYRRQLFVPMVKNFKGIERRYIKDDYLHRPEVLQYMLKRVLHMDYYVLSEPEATQRVLSEYKDFNDPVRAFFEEFHDQFTWDLLPFSFLYDLYKAWFAKTSPSGSLVGRNTFIKDIGALVRSDQYPQWACEDSRAKIRVSTRMSVPETLVAQYDLSDWKNPGYTGSDPKIIGLPPVDKTQSFCGVQRIATVAQLGMTQGTGTSGPDPNP